MAIFTLTASKATPRKGIRYIMDKGKMELWWAWNLDPNADLAQQIIDTQRLWKKGKLAEERKYYHLKIAFSPKDRKEKGGTLTDELALKFALDFCRRKFPTAEAVISVQSHGKTRHIHIIISAVDPMTGKKLQFSDHYQRVLKDLAQDKMCREYGLEAMDWRDAMVHKWDLLREGSTEYAKTTAEVRIKERGGYGWKDELREIIDGAMSTAESKKAFEQLLLENGVTLPRNTSTTISYQYTNGAGEKFRAVRGNKLGESYTAEAIEMAFAERQRPTGLDGLIYAAESQKKTKEKKKLPSSQSKTNELCR